LISWFISSGLFAFFLDGFWTYSTARITGYLYDLCNSIMYILLNALSININKKLKIFPVVMVIP